MEITKKGNQNCQHRYICAGKKSIRITLARCVECGQEEEHKEEN